MRISSRQVEAELPLTAAERAAVRAFSGWLRGHFGERISELSLFGSRARGEGHAESDVDLLVAIDDLTSAARREIACESGEAMTQWAVLLSPFALSTERLASLRSRERLIAREIDRDGIAL